VSDPLRLADVLGGLSMVADCGFGLTLGTAVRTSLVATALARRMELHDGDVRDSFYTGLLMHVGCVGVAHESTAAFGDDIALNRAVARTDVGDPDDIVATFLPELTRGMSADRAAAATSFLFTQGIEWARRADVGVCEIARDTARRLGLPESTQQALYHVYEHWAGGWVPHGFRGDDIAVGARVARAAMDAAFFGQLGGVDAAVTALRKRAGGVLDPAVVAVFVDHARDVLAEADDGDPHDLMLAAEPRPVEVRSPADLPELAAAFGDLTDIKMPFLHGHSRHVAELAAGGARRLGLDSAEVRRVEIAGLLHDVGRVAISNAIWEKPGRLTRAEWEQVRMHGYHSERVVATSPTLAGLAPIIGMHHERLDGSGYHRGCTATAIPMAARLVAVADAFAAMIQPRPYRSPLTPAQAVSAVTADTAAGRFDHDAAAAVLAEAGHRTPRRRHRPAGLSDREVDVLRLIAAGHSNADVAERLVISRRTAEHHAQHIYTKIGVSSRAAAALFAVQHELVRPGEHASGRGRDR
jgi:HD-GYP domain-containing protein (c-di-GMP phosphodiesterase class II)